MPIYWLPEGEDPRLFPNPEEAEIEPNGLLAAGGELSEQRLVAAYQQGIFPWYSEGQPILWWSPNPRAVLFPEQLKISRSLRKTIKKGHFRISFDLAFKEVLQLCAAPRDDGAGTWITPEMESAYCHLNEKGIAHSVETWLDDRLVGGLYGLAIGQVFFGESMFSRETDASKVALAQLVAQLKHWQFKLIDCQVTSAHLASLGAIDIPRADFIALLDRLCQEAVTAPVNWASTQAKFS